MNPLTRTLYGFLSQEVARQNAATATDRVLRERQQRAEVDAYLAHVDRAPPVPARTPSNQASGHARPGAKARGWL